MNKPCRSVGYHVAQVVQVVSCVALWALILLGLDMPGARFSALVMLLAACGYTIGWDKRGGRKP